MSKTSLFKNDAILDAVVKLGNEIEKHVIATLGDSLRASIREEIISEIRGKLFADTVENSAPLPESDPQPMTDLHGEPVTSAPVKKHRRIPAEYWKTYQRPLSEKHHAMITVLRGAKWLTTSQIAKSVDLKATTVQQYLYDLQDHGLPVQSRKTNWRYGRNGKRGHRKMYRLAASQ